MTLLYRQIKKLRVFCGKQLTVVQKFIRYGVQNTKKIFLKSKGKTERPENLIL